MKDGGFLNKFTFNFGISFLLHNTKSTRDFFFSPVSVSFLLGLPPPPPPPPPPCPGDAMGGMFIPPPPPKQPTVIEGSDPNGHGYPVGPEG